MKYVGWRYGARFSHDYDTLEEAIQMATAAANNGDAAFECIENDDGTIALDKAALGEAIDKQNEMWDAAEALRIGVERTYGEAHPAGKIVKLTDQGNPKR